MYQNMTMRISLEFSPQEGCVTAVPELLDANGEMKFQMTPVKCFPHAVLYLGPWSVNLRREDLALDLALAMDVKPDDLWKRAYDGDTLLGGDGSEQHVY